MYLILHKVYDKKTCPIWLVYILFPTELLFIYSKSLLHFRAIVFHSDLPLWVSSGSSAGSTPPQRTGIYNLMDWVGEAVVPLMSINCGVYTVEGVEKVVLGSFFSCW